MYPIPNPEPFDTKRPWTNAGPQVAYGLLREYRGQGLGEDSVGALLFGFVFPRMRMRAVGAVRRSHRLR